MKNPKKNNAYVFTNFANSMDGKISTTKKININPTEADRKLMDLHRFRADVIVNGAGTVRAYKRPMLIQSNELKKKRVLKGRLEQPVNAVVSFSLNMSPKWEYFTSDKNLKILFVSKAIDLKKVRPFESRCRIVFFDPEKNIAEQVLKYLKMFGFKMILLEGGGELMPPWVDADLIDEWNLTLSPKIIGGRNAPTMVEGEGASKIRYYHLKQAKKVKDELFLQYVRKK